MNPSKRFRATLAAALFMALATVLAIFKGMEALASTSVAGIMTILSTYIWSQTKRPHAYEENRTPPGTAPAGDPPGRDTGPGGTDTL